jgi:signal transduction histidine kinase
VAIRGPAAATVADVAEKPDDEPEVHDGPEGEETRDRDHPDHESVHGLGILAFELNETFGKLEAALERQARFTADASHELRTPTFVILSQVQPALRKERSAEEYRAALQVCERAAQQTRRLIDSLLLLARHEAPPPATVIAPGREVSLSLPGARPGAGERGRAARCTGGGDHRRTHGAG